MLKLGYNEATCKENSTVENDLLLCEKYGYDYIELRLDMLQEYLKTHTVDDLKAFFAKSHIKPFAFNSIENINFCTPEEWEKLVELFTFGCKVAQHATGARACRLFRYHRLRAGTHGEPLAHLGPCTPGEQSRSGRRRKRSAHP